MEITNTPYEPFFFIVLGAIFLLCPFLTRSKLVKLQQTGEVVEGIIFECDEMSFNSRTRDSSEPSATIRFVTKTKDWITEPITWDNISVSYTGQFK